MKTGQRSRAGMFLAAVGVLVVLAEVVMHFLAWWLARPYELNHGILLVGAVVGFVGFYMLDPKQAAGGASILVNAGVAILKTLPRFGRRSTDAVAIPEATTTVEAIPVAAGRDEAEGLEPTP